MMITKEALCKKIEEVFPKVGACGIDFDVEFDDKVQAWTVDLHHEDRHLRTFVDVDEASVCLEGKLCIPLGVQVGQLKHNFDLLTCSEH
ncbi:MAG: hypothetical protein ACWGKN_01300 [Desulfoprunum sp.]